GAGGHGDSRRHRGGGSVHQHRLSRAIDRQPRQSRLSLLPRAEPDVMYRRPPRIDQRSADDVFEALCARLQERVDWSRPDPVTEALIRVFARYWQIIAARLNQSLDKHFFAYLDLLGV